MRTRLLALDIDGTLLDPYGKLPGGVRRAVGAALERGLQVVLCTGRRFRTALPTARALALSGPIVVHNGVLVKDLETGETELDRYLPEELYREMLALMRELGPPLVYVDAFHEQTDIVTEAHPRAHPIQCEYLDDNDEYTRVVEDLTASAHARAILMSTMGDLQDLEPLRQRAEARFGERILSHVLINKVYRGHILEFLAPDSGKWATLVRLAARQGIAPEEIAAVGDDANDVDMIRGAGLGIAMGNAVAEARAAADMVVRSNAEGGAIEAIERVLLEK
jgi:Cof subfamily protein (haloacid dehalogenase superfamily)